MTVKTLHFKAVNISRNKTHPDNAVKACAYRCGQNLTEEKTGQTHYYGNRKGIIETAIFAPENAPGWMADTKQKRVWERFGNEIERVEDGHNRRASAMLGKDFQVAAPRELSNEQNWELAEAFAQKLNERGLAVAVAYHIADASDGGQNPHFHFFVPMRSVTEEGFGKRYRTLDAPGKGKENPEMKALRHDYFKCVADALEDAGIKGVFYDPDKQDGKEPGIHLGKQASAMEKRGQDTYLAEHNRQVGYGNFMRQYDTVTEDNHWLVASSTEDEDWRRRVTDWQLQRGAAMAARDAALKSQSNVDAPAANRSERRTEMSRQEALLAYRQSQRYQDRSDDHDRSR